jgi:exosortase A-associated hydrolase 2
MISDHSGYFDSGNYRLYGTYRAAAAAAGAALICPPFGEERKCAARLLNETTRTLHAQGNDVLSFDFAGTGDSTGEHADMSIAQWRADCVAAANHLQAAADTTNFAGVGARLGANLALQSLGGVFNRFVLWAPLLSGAEYLDEIIRRKQIKEAVGGGQADAYDRTTLWEESDVIDFDGFEISKQFAEELTQLDLLATLNNLPDCYVFILHITGARALSPSWQAVADLCERRRHFQFQELHEKPFWGRQDYSRSEALINSTADFCLAETAVP